MKPVEIPTDNLYKFMAVAGVVTGLACIYLATNLTSKHHDRWYEHVVAYQVLHLDVEDLQEDMESVRQGAAGVFERIKEFQDEHGEGVSTATRPLFSSILASHIATEESLAQVNERLRQVQREVVKGGLEHGQLRTIGLRLGILFWILWIGAGASFSVAVWGFVLWYARVQRHLDRVLASGDGEPMG